MRDICFVPDKDENQIGCDPEASRDALQQVEELVGSEPVNGEDPMESEDVKRQLREAKKPLSDAGRSGQ